MRKNNQFIKITNSFFPHFPNTNVDGDYKNDFYTSNLPSYLDIELAYARF